MPFGASRSGLRGGSSLIEAPAPRGRENALRLTCVIISLLVLSCCLPGSVLSPTSEDANTDVADRASSLALVLDAVEFSASPASVYVGEEVTFFANATSTIGADLTFLIYFEYYTAGYENNTYSPYYVTTTSSPGNIVVPHIYDHVGNLSGGLGTYFRVRLYVGDGENTVYKGISVYVIDNVAPTIPLKLPEAIELTYRME